MTLPRYILVLVLAAAAAAQDLGPTLMRAASVETAPGADGFIHRWLILEPIPANGLTDSVVQSTVKKEYFPNQLGVIPRDGDQVSVGDSQLKWHAVESRLYNVNLFHFARSLGKQTSNVLFWAVTIVNAPEEIAGARLAIGSNAASVWWVNGQEVIGIYGDRQTVIDDGVSKRLTLRKGLNVIRAAIVNGGGATDFCARLLDGEDRPLRRFSIRLGDGPVAATGAKPSDGVPTQNARASSATPQELPDVRVQGGNYRLRGGRQTWTADNGNGTYTNPLFFDEFSDPDLIRVGSDFYLTGTTMHSMPGLPILHSRDLVNWTFLTYALDKLDLGPSFRLEDGKTEYGRGIWAPCFRYHKGTFYIFSNVNGQTTQLFRATNARGPWTRTPMKRSLHDLSVLFDDDGKAFVVWGYRGIRLAELTPDLTDIVPGSEREIIPPTAGMGEGLHLYKIRGKYILTSAWFLDEMRMPVARADKLDGPWEVNQNVSRGEDFGLGVGYRVAGRQPPFRISPPDNSHAGRCAIHQGGIVDTPTGEWWGFSMMDANSVGRLTALSPVTWSDGWPYFGLPGNLGRTPRTWVKPNTGSTSPPRAPYRRSDDFSDKSLQPVWQWNHVPVDGRWSLTERPGFLRLHALPASDLWRARNTLTQRAMGPRSTVTIVMETAGMKAGDVAGLALFNRPYAWLGIEKSAAESAVTLFDEVTGKISRVSFGGSRIWLRAECDFIRNVAKFGYSFDGKTFAGIGEPHTMAYGLITFQGVRYSLFSYNTQSTAGGGFADFDSIAVNEEPRRAIPFGTNGELTSADGASKLRLGAAEQFRLIDRGLGRVALQADGSYVSVDATGSVSLRKGQPGKSETFQWMETFDGHVALLSLSTNRFLRVDAQNGRIAADSPGPRPDGRDGVRLQWRARQPGG